MDSRSTRGPEGLGLMQPRGDGAPTLAPRAAKTREKVPRASSPAALASLPPSHGGASPSGTQGSHPAHTGSPARALWLPKRLFFPGQMELFKVMGITSHLQPGQAASPLPSPSRRDRRQRRPSSPAPRPACPAGPPPHRRWDARPPPPCAVPGKGGSQLLQTTFSGRDGLGSQARRWQPAQPWPLSSPPRSPQPSFPRSPSPT